MREIIEEKLLRLVQLYTFNTPIRKGKYRLFQTALSLCKTRPDSLPVRLRDGRRFYANLSTGIQETVFFIGEFERVLSEIASRLIQPGDICIDVGANFGWYTSLMDRAGAGEVHAFEPTPRTFQELQRNRELMSSPSRVHLNNLALGDSKGTVQIHLFEGLGSGNASLSAKSDVDASEVFDCEMITLDEYLEVHGIANVDFVKVDIEGAELMFLKAAEQLFTQQVPPVMLVEMAAGQTRNFGYHCDELIKFIAARSDYEFFAVDEYQGTARRISGFAEDEIGANVFCIPKAGSDELRVVMSEYLVN